MAQAFRHRMLLGLTAAVVAAAYAFAIGAARAADAQQEPQNEMSTKVWTNDNISSLPNLSIQTGTQPLASAQSGPGPAQSQNGWRVLPPREQDPAWYRVQIAELRRQAAQLEARAHEIQSVLDSHTGGHQGLNLLEKPEGLNAETEVKLLRQRRAGVLQQIDALEDMARRNGLAPGEVRREPSAQDYAIYRAITSPPPPPPEGPPQTEEQWRARFASLRRELAAAIEERDVLQREFGIAELQYYPNPLTTLKEEYTFHDLNQLRARIDAQDAKIASLKQQISDLEDALRRAGGPPGWSRTAGD
jgi:hypothetical protein